MKICWITINVKDMATSLQFYTEIMNMTVKNRFSPQPGLDICFLDGGTVALELICKAATRDISYGKDVSIGFEVDSLEVTIAQLKEKGISNIIGPIQPTPDTSFIFITDPDGMRLQLSEHK